MTNKEKYLNDVKESVRYAIEQYLKYLLPRYTDFTVVDSRRNGMLRRYQSETIDAIDDVFEEHNFEEDKQLGWWFSPYSKNDIQIF